MKPACLKSLADDLPEAKSFLEGCNVDVNSAMDFAKQKILEEGAKQLDINPADLIECLNEAKANPALFAMKHPEFLSTFGACSGGIDDACVQSIVS